MNGELLSQRAAVADVRVGKLTDFSDYLRGFAMVGVVAIHCVLPFEGQRSDHVLDQFGKFANGLFFLISAYLWQFRNGSARPGTYLWNRVNSLVLPYVVWAGITLVVVCGWYATSPNRSFDVVEILSFVFGHTAMWFIPQVLVSLYVVSVAWRRLGQTWSGVLFGVITAVYGVNLHAGWMDIGHPVAPLGFASFAWLGYVIYEHEDGLRDWLIRVPIPAWLVAGTLAYLAGLSESIYLDNSDSLRITNVLYSLVMSAMIIAVCYRLRLKGREVPAGMTYGIYLIHTVVMLCITLACAMFISDTWQLSYQPAWYANLGLRILLIAIVWWVSRTTVLLMNRVGLGRLAGAPASTQASRVRESA